MTQDATDGRESTNRTGNRREPLPVDLKGRRAVVTGGSRGIGAAIVHGLAARGATVAFCAREQAGVDALVADMGGSRGAVHGYVADFGHAVEVSRFLDVVSEEVGECDIVVNNVGAAPSRNFLYMDDEDWEHLFEVNLMSAVRCTKRFLPAMRAAGWGRVVMIATTAAKYPGASLIDYAATKGAMVATASALSKKYGADGVLVNSVLPGLIRTSMWERTAAEIAEATGREVEDVFAQNAARVPVGRYGLAGEIADVVLFLVSEHASYVNGAAIDVDGGLGTFVY